MINEKNIFNELRLSVQFIGLNKFIRVFDMFWIYIYIFYLCIFVIWIIQLKMSSSHCYIFYLYVFIFSCNFEVTSFLNPILYVCVHITLKNNDMKSFLMWLAKEIPCIGDILYISKPQIMMMRCHRINMSVIIPVEETGKDFKWVIF